MPKLRAYLKYGLSPRLRVSAGLCLRQGAVRILRELVVKDHTFVYACYLYIDLVSHMNIKQNAGNE